MPQSVFSFHWVYYAVGQSIIKKYLPHLDWSFLCNKYVSVFLLPLYNQNIYWRVQCVFSSCDRNVAQIDLHSHEVLEGIYTKKNKGKFMFKQTYIKRIQ